MPPFSFREPNNSEGQDSKIAANDAVFKKPEAVPQKVEYVETNPVTDEEFKKFINNGEVSEDRTRALYYKTKNHATFSEREVAMYSAVHEKIEDMLKTAMKLEK